MNFRTWYSQNMNYYKIKHEGQLKKMRVDAHEAYQKMISFTHEPKKSR